MKIRLHTLKKRQDFASFRKQKANHYAFKQFVMLALPMSFETTPKFGFIITKKIGKAVIRNRVRRRLKHCVRYFLQKNPLFQQWHILFIVRNAIKEASFQSLMGRTHEALCNLPCEA